MPTKGGKAWSEPDETDMPDAPDDDGSSASGSASGARGKKDRGSVVSEIAKDKKSADEKDKALIEAYDRKLAAGKEGVKAAQLNRMLKVDPSTFTGVRAIAHNWLSWWGFDFAIGIIIAGNAITLGVETQAKASVPLGCTPDCDCTQQIDMSKDCKLPPDIINYLDMAFLGVYIIELSARFGTYGIYVLKSHWVKFDTFLVISSLLDLTLETVAASDPMLKRLMVVRILRAVRLARALRLMVQFQTLWQLVQGLLHSVGTLLWTFLLVMILICVLAIFGMELIKVDPDLPLEHPYNAAAIDNFKKFPDAIMTLLQLFSFDSIGGIYRPLIKHKFVLFFYFIVVMLLLSIALMNLVTAVMVNSSLAQASEDRDAKKAWEAAKKAKQMEQVKIMFLELDEDRSGELTIDELTSSPEEAQDQLREIAGTDDLVELFEMLDYDGGGTVGVEEFCEGVLKATSSNPGTMELGRLVKQCGDILKNSRETVKVLTDPSKGWREFAKKGAPAGGAGGGGGGGVSNIDMENLQRLNGKVGKVETELGKVHADITRILQIVNDRSSKNKTSSMGLRTATSHSPSRRTGHNRSHLN
mmetsp:Transcript_2282/g.4150  ORF Transcript_2282/g.4150 Transcript_2282/m.4150 type:complete len:585 (-) Transcript_2282:40-1794(-)